jgi:riboflavin synthase
MFTGIIEEIAQVKRMLKSPQGYKLTVESKIVSKGTRIGDSISVNGVCLTNVETKGKDLSFDVMEETLCRTSLTELSARKIVNLERSLKAGDRISGHFVTGHIDCIGKIYAITKRPNNYAMDIEFPIDKRAYLTEKGCIAIDGVSLTITSVKDRCLRVYLIPLTLNSTNLGSKKVGDLVNIEFDVLGKYSLQNLESESEKERININFLKKHGFL